MNKVGKIKKLMSPREAAQFLTQLAKVCQDWDAYTDVVENIIIDAMYHGAFGSKDTTTKTIGAPKPGDDER